MTQERDIKAKVLETIHNGKVSMRPKVFFAARAVTLVALVVLASVLSLFVLSFTFWSLHESGEQSLLGFGGRGVGTFLALFPWTAFFVTVVLLIVIEKLIRSFRFGYRVSLLRLFGGIMVLAVVLGALITLTPLHSVLQQHADRDELSFLNKLYQDVHARHEDQGVFRGIVLTVTPTDITVSRNDFDQDTDDGTFHVVPPPGFDAMSLIVGSHVFIGGEPGSDGTIQAYGIQVISPWTHVDHKP